MSRTCGAEAPEASVVEPCSSSVAASSERAGKPAATREKKRSSSASSSSSSSERRRRANLANAKKSTGPRTDEGKQRASRIAVRHGLFSQDLILPGERLVDFLRLRLSFHASLRATDALEYAIIERAVIAQWRLRRCQSAELDLHRAAPGRRDEQHMKLLLGGGRRRDISLALSLLPEEDQEAGLANQSMSASETLALDIEDPHSAIDRLSRYEQRLENQFFKALRELRALRKTIPPVLDDEFMAQIGAYSGVETMMDELRACEARERVAHDLPLKPESSVPDVNAPVKNEANDEGAPRERCVGEERREPARGYTNGERVETTSGHDDASVRNQASIAPASEATENDETFVQNEATSKVVLQMPEESEVDEGAMRDHRSDHSARSNEGADLKSVADDDRVT
jgi:hypothetical protein